jgi:hypothetical protein
MVMFCATTADSSVHCDVRLPLLHHRRTGTLAFIAQFQRCWLRGLFCSDQNAVRLMLRFWFIPVLAGSTTGSPQLQITSSATMPATCRRFGLFGGSAENPTPALVTISYHSALRFFYQRCMVLLPRQRLSRYVVWRSLGCCKHVWHTGFYFWFKPGSACAIRPSRTCW